MGATVISCEGKIEMIYSVKLFQQFRLAPIFTKYEYQHYKRHLCLPEVNRE